MFFHPDPTIFPKSSSTPRSIRERLEVASYLHKGVKVIFEDEATGRSDVFQHDEGHRRLPEEDPGRARGQAGARGAVRRCEKDERRPARARAAVDRVHRRARAQLRQRHPHRLAAARTRTASAPASARRSATTSRRTTSRRKGVTLTAEDIREGVVGVLCVFVAEPQFQGQTKDRLNNPEVQSAVDGAGAPGAGALAEQATRRSPSDRRAGSSWRRAPARRAARRRQESARKTRDVAAGSTCPASSPTAQPPTATTPSCSSSKATRPAAPPSRAATATPRRSCRCAARCSTPRGVSLGQGAREQGAHRPRHRARLRRRREVRPRPAPLRQGHPPDRRRQRRPPHHHAAADVLLPPHAAS